jgi:para-nitrobenzyl esterase
MSALAAGPALARVEPAPVRDTSLGPVRGQVSRWSANFLGIPYASAPVGRLRWRAPQKPQGWRQPLDATRFGALCLQPHGPGPRQYSEDCLTLNISTPLYARPGSRLPVLFRIHGGGFVGGAGAYEHTADVWNREGVILVTFNYRLGALGVFAHSALINEASARGEKFSANLAVLDMREALSWVHSNIGRFGGDPDNITITGVSAGGQGVQLLDVLPSARGLYARSISSSGYSAWPLPRLEKPGTARPDPDGVVAKAAVALAERASGGRPVATVEELQALPGDALIKAVNGFVLPIVDGTSLVGDPISLFAQGRHTPGPMLIGGNSFEGTVYPASGVTDAQLVEMFGQRWPALEQAYADDFALSQKQGLKRIFGDARYVVSSAMVAARVARTEPVYLYYNTYVSPGLRSVQPGAGHGSETPLLERGSGPGNPGPLMKAYWLNFIRTGNPNAAGLPEWPRTDEQHRHWMVFGEQSEARTNLLKPKLDVLEAAYGDRSELPQAHSVRPELRHERPQSRGERISQNRIAQDAQSRHRTP